MKEPNFKDASVDEIVAGYAAATAQHGAATTAGDSVAANAAQKTIAAAYAELRQRAPLAREALLPLLRSSDPGTRLWSASHALEFAPAEGEAVLRALSAAHPLLSFTAEMTLSEWNAGRLRFRRAFRAKRS